MSLIERPGGFRIGVAYCPLHRSCYAIDSSGCPHVAPCPTVVCESCVILCGCPHAVVIAPRRGHGVWLREPKTGGLLCLTVSAWCRRLGLKRRTVEERIARGWTVKRALETPTADAAPVYWTPPEVMP